MRRSTGHPRRRPSDVSGQSRGSEGGAEIDYPIIWPPGHFYSPYPDLDEVREREEGLRSRTALMGIDLREDAQWALAEELRHYYDELPFSAEPSEGLRYHYENPNFGYGDAVFFFSMLRYLAPRRLIEVGSGYSSCLTLDTVERFSDDGSVELVFIDPHADLIRSLTSDSSGGSAEIVEKPVQDVDLKLFLELEENDILFIDSSHVAKVGSDVNHLFFEVVPRLAPGVVVHVHDVFFPFEYPSDWIYEGRAWNELYVLRAFLQYNDAFEILLFTHFLMSSRPEWFAEHMPLSLRDPGGSMWLRRRR